MSASPRSRTKQSEIRHFRSHFDRLWEMNDVSHSSSFRERVQKTSKSRSEYVDQQFRQKRKVFKEHFSTTVSQRWRAWNSWTRRMSYRKARKYSTLQKLEPKRVLKSLWYFISHVQYRQTDIQITELWSSKRELRPAHRRSVLILLSTSRTLRISITTDDVHHISVLLSCLVTW